ncbi:hypothetical protein AMD24_00091 [Candidatus Xiphinematobacter sp. Idaho Grape]|nr:hypothetical protein AMD24_00091 [Candidatus Xiphinematobacter sp. Idaho Grape]
MGMVAAGACCGPWDGRCSMCKHLYQVQAQTNFYGHPRRGEGRPEDSKALHQVNSFPTKQLILAEIRQSRLAVGNSLFTLAQELNVAKKIRRSVRIHLNLFLGLASITGFLLARFLGRRKKNLYSQERGDHSLAPLKSFTLWGVLLTTFRFLVPLVKPTVLAYVGKKVREVVRSAGS